MNDKYFQTNKGVKPIETPKLNLDLGDNEELITEGMEKFVRGVQNYVAEIVKTQDKMVLDEVNKYCVKLSLKVFVSEQALIETIKKCNAYDKLLKNTPKRIKTNSFWKKLKLTFSKRGVWY